MGREKEREDTEARVVKKIFCGLYVERKVLRGEVSEVGVADSQLSSRREGWA